MDSSGVPVKKREHIQGHYQRYDVYIQLAYQSLLGDGVDLWLSGFIASKRRCAALLLLLLLLLLV